MRYSGTDKIIRNAQSLAIIQNMKVKSRVAPLHFNKCLGHVCVDLCVSTVGDECSQDKDCQRSGVGPLGDNGRSLCRLSGDAAEKSGACVCQLGQCREYLISILIKSGACETYSVSVFTVIHPHDMCI